MIKVIRPYWKWVGLSESKMDQIPQHLEECGRTCYKSEDLITDDSAGRFVRNICRRRHESVLEHEVLTARLVCSRACSHQLVRHRIAAYSQESQRFCDYGKNRYLQVICPSSVGVPAGVYEYKDGGWDGTWDSGSMTVPNHRWADWLNVRRAEYQEYLFELTEGLPPEDARYNLPNACKTEVVCTYNLRMWRHVIMERGLNKHAQWEIRELFSDIHRYLSWKLPSIFGDLE